MVLTPLQWSQPMCSLWPKTGSEGTHDRRRSLEEALPDFRGGTAVRRTYVHAWARHRLFRPRPARRLEAGGRHPCRHWRYRCGLCAAPPQAQLGAARSVKRFWEKADAVATEHGFAIELDGRRVKTPAKADLILPTEQLADAVAQEWNSVVEIIDPREMPLTGLANAAIDRIAP